MGIPARESGFSLIELSVGLAVMGIVAAIALPRWSSLLPTYALNNSLRQVQSELHHIKMRAAAENVSYQLAYQQGAAAYTIQRDAKAIVSRPLADGTTITKDGTIAFSPRGTARANRVRLRNSAGACKQIVVSATGRVRVCTPKSCNEDC
ncbi:MAG TPA: prepilin-type N-terminal cleavage/methylation domain-containing protein [Verrucomicrobiae bacterium]|nr:prepilin-type N-terminal cleavage/methylation domain-containing protein [Verrucomicrobiae bacterium]